MELGPTETGKLVAQLPPEVQDALRRHQEAGTYDDPEYKAATKVFNERHLCRVVPNPQEVIDSDNAIRADPTVYHTMNGPNEFHIVGTLGDWSVVDRVHLITAPTLLINGAFDEATAATMQPFYDAIPDVRWEVFTESSHMPHVEEEDRFLEVVGAFLREHD